MTPLTANLKPFYQRRALWAFYVWLGLTTVPFSMLVFTRPRAGGHGTFSGFAGYLIVSLVMGLAAAAMQHEIMLKPFSFMLPGHRRLPKTVVLVVGLLVNLLLGLVFLRYPGLTGMEAWGTVGAAAALGLAVYIVGAMLVFGTRTVNPVLGFLPLLFIGASVIDLNIAVVIAVTQYPQWVVAGSLTAVALAWPYLGGTALARRLCGTRGLGLFESFNMRKAQEYRRQAVAERLKRSTEDGPSRRERWFAACMGRCAPYGAGRAVCGIVYERLGAYPVRLLAGQVLGPLALLLLFGYGGPPYRYGSLANIAFVAAGMSSLHCSLPTAFLLPLPLGRRERLLATLAGLAALGLITGFVLALMTAFSLAVAPFMPPITIKGMTLPYRSMDSRLLVLTGLVLPLGTLSRTFLRDNLLRMLPMMVLLGGAWFWMSAFAALPWTVQAGALAAVWGLTLALLWYHCARRDLSTG
jgi:hypothetical protein